MHKGNLMRPEWSKLEETPVIVKQNLNEIIMNLIAKNPKHQTMVNRCVNWLKKYNEYNTQRDIADGNGDDKQYAKWDKKCSKAFDMYLEYLSELPKREVTQIEKSELY